MIVEIFFASNNHFYRSLSNTEGDCSHLKEANERSQQDLQELALKYSLQQQKTEELASKLQVITNTFYLPEQEP